jgi:hypothetical protein
MPSFLSKVFGRGKKHDEKSRDAPSSPLGGKFEAVRLSPGPPSLNENGDKSANGKEKTSPTREMKLTEAPLLSLNLSGIQDASSSQPSSAVFDADPDSRVLLPDSVIGAKRLSPSETLALVKTCGQAITERGLETLGLMHPHWYSASPEVQRKLISHFLQSLSSGGSSTTTGLSTSGRFQSEVHFTRSPHDIASVFRWGLRHLQFVDKPTFGNDPDWYSRFFDQERSSSHSPQAFSEHLVPLIPASHLELLKYTLEIISYIAAHAEANGISGSRLTKFLGLWLLDPSGASVGSDWTSLYEKWDQAGRILEHIFLANIRDEATRHPLPLRLTQIVNHYPYGPTDSVRFLPKPKFSTRQYDALLISLESPYNADKNKLHPIVLVTEAFKADAAEHTEESSVSEDPWTKIKTEGASSEDAGSIPPISSLFADETIRLISLIPGEANADAIIPLSNFTVHRATVERQRSTSLTQPSRPSFSQETGANGSFTPGHAHHKSISSVAESRPSLSVVTSPLGATDWGQFSKSGFLEDSALGTPLAATLMDHDIETTNPPTQRKKSVTRKRGRKSLDSPAVGSSQPITPQTGTTSQSEEVGLSTYKWRVVSVDEAFIDFWSDSLTDPISSHWPNFFVYRLKAPIEENGQRIEWVVLERTIAKPPSPPSPEPETPSVSTPTTAGGARPRATSPRPSMTSATKKRFTFFSATSIRKSNSTHSKKNKKEGARTPQIGEMGEILDEEAQPRRSTTVSKAPENVPIPETPMLEAQKSLPASPDEIPGVITTLPPTNAPSAVETIKEDAKEHDASGPSDATVASVAVGATALAVGGALATAVVHKEEDEHEPEQKEASAKVPSLKLDDATLAKADEEEAENDGTPDPTDSPVDLKLSSMVAAAAAEKYHDKAGHESVVITPSASIHEDDDPMDDFDEDDQSEEEKPSENGPSVGASTIIVPPATSTDEGPAPLAASTFTVLPVRSVPEVAPASAEQEQETVFSAAIPVHHQEPTPLEEISARPEEDVTPLVEEDATPVTEKVPTAEEETTPVAEEPPILAQEGPSLLSEDAHAAPEEVDGEDTSNQVAPTAEEHPIVREPVEETGPAIEEVPIEEAAPLAKEAHSTPVTVEEPTPVDEHPVVVTAVVHPSSNEETTEAISSDEPRYPAAPVVEEPVEPTPVSVAEEAEPIVQDTQPATDEVVPVVEEAEPVVEEAEQAGEAAEPTVDEAAEDDTPAPVAQEPNVPVVEIIPALAGDLLSFEEPSVADADQISPVLEDQAVEPSPSTEALTKSVPQDAAAPMSEEPLADTERAPVIEETAPIEDFTVAAADDLAMPEPQAAVVAPAEVPNSAITSVEPVEEVSEPVTSTHEEQAHPAPEGFTINTPRIESLAITKSQDASPQDSLDLAPVPVVENVPETSPVLMPKPDEAPVLAPEVTLSPAVPVTENTESANLENVLAAGETPGPELALNSLTEPVDSHPTTEAGETHVEQPITTDPADPPTNLAASQEAVSSSPLIANEPLVDDEKPTAAEVESSPLAAPTSGEAVLDLPIEHTPVDESTKPQATSAETS